MNLTEIAWEVIELAEPPSAEDSRRAAGGTIGSAESPLRHSLRSLEEDVIYSLLLIMYVGRGEIHVNGISKAARQLRINIPNIQAAIAQLQKAQLSNHLRDGLTKLEKAKIDVNSLPEL